MRRKFAIGIIIFFSAFMLNVSAMAFQQRYDRREDDEDFDPFVIEMTDLHVLKYLKNTWYFEFPLNQTLMLDKKFFVNDDLGFGQQYQFSTKPDLSSQLKFVLIDYIGFYKEVRNQKTYYLSEQSG